MALDNMGISRLALYRVHDVDIVEGTIPQLEEEIGHTLLWCSKSFVARLYSSLTRRSSKGQIEQLASYLQGVLKKEKRRRSRPRIERVDDCLCGCRIEAFACCLIWQSLALWLKHKVGGGRRIASWYSRRVGRRLGFPRYEASNCAQGRI